MFNGIQDLEENLLGQVILTNILASLGDVQEQVTFRAIFENNVDAIRLVHNLEHLDHIAVCGCQVVETNFTLLVGNLSALQRGSIHVELAQALDGIANSSVDVEGQVDDAIGSGSKDIS